MLGGRVEAGTNFNVTPDFCSFPVERRIDPEENLEEEKRRLRDALEGFEIEAFRVFRGQSLLPCCRDPSHPLLITRQRLQAKDGTIVRTSNLSSLNYFVAENS
ncbi:MAG TPA: peptidase dimerization domain-containing protein [Chthoniobacterales bacterium]|jgi:acetylornithine deacetylase/succinyl-diaminopimelate desuccinylase-like protein|nr:peptidase dimerization domain-containing protein [Chthoniobacterales bacterium]